MKKLLHLSYDITEDKLRTNLADDLLALGFVRVQYSVYIGSVNEAKLLRLLTRYIGKMQGSDKLDIMEISETQLQSLRQFGINIQSDIILGREGLLFF